MAPATSSWRRWPPRVVDSGEEWTTVYEVDFTNMGSGKNTDWRTAGDSASVTLDGGHGDSAVWLAHATDRTQTNIVNSAGVCKLEHGTGLHLSCVSGPNMWEATTNAIKVLAKITDLVNGMTAEDTVCVQLRANANKDPLVQPNSNDIANFGLYVGRLAASQSRWDWGKNGALLQNIDSGHTSDVWISQVRGGNGAAFRRTDNTNPDYFEMIMYPMKGKTGGTIKMLTGDWGGSFPYPDSAISSTSYMNLNRSINSAGASSTLALSDIYVGFYGLQLNITGSDIPLYTAYSLRVLKLVT